MDEKLKREAVAFDERIVDRTNSGFVPDLSKVERNEYFYKSFWRDPIYVDLYLRQIVNFIGDWLEGHLRPGARVLDLGCGPGYVTLELASRGYEMVGVDISERAIHAGRRAYASRGPSSLKGSIKYFVDAAEGIEKYGYFDAVVSTGFLHHIPDIQSIVGKICNVLNPNGWLLMHEPQHRSFRLEHAAVVATFRQILSVLNMWHEDSKDLTDSLSFWSYANDVMKEYQMERDSNEVGGQSPNDLSCEREEILAAIDEKFEIGLDKPSFSFIYRFLGGMRGEADGNTQFARFMALVDRELVEAGVLSANYFYCFAKKRSCV